MRADDTLEQVVGHAAQHQAIEVLFADFKELMGSDHYQMRSVRAIVRFWAVGLYACQFLDEVRATHRRTWGEYLALGQARQQIRESHREELAVQFAFLLMQIDPVDEALAANEVRSHPGEEFAF